MEEGEVYEEIPEEKEDYPTTALDGTPILLFGKWSLTDVVIRDPGLRRYISLRPVYIPHTEGRHEKKRFLKSKVPIVERLINQLMRLSLIHI